MNEVFVSHWFGLRPNVEPVPDLYWGARAIFKNPDCLDIVHDRQQFNNYASSFRKPREDLWAWAQEKGVPRLRKELVKQSVSTRDACLVTVLDSNYTIIADPRKSAGYLYIGAWCNDSESSFRRT